MAGFLDSRRPRTAPPDAARLGTVELGCFRLQEVLGRGSYGTAFLAEQEGFDRPAVVKIAHPGLMDGRDHDAVRARFASELRAATRVSHPSVVTLFTAGDTTDGLPAIAMEYVKGETLESLLERRAGQLAPRFLFEVFEQLASAMEAFHLASVTHRDLSPTNIVVGQDGQGQTRVKVLDFGAAKIGGTGGSRSVVGTPRYMSPEQVIGAAGAPSDIYAMGAILWWALTGQEFQSDVLTLEDVTRARIMGAPPTDIRELVPGIPAAVAELLSRMLAFDETTRPVAGEFLHRWRGAAKEIESMQSVSPSVAEPAANQSHRARPSRTMSTSQTRGPSRTVRDSPLRCVVLESNAIRAGVLRGLLQQVRCPVVGEQLPPAGDPHQQPDVVFVSAQLPTGSAGAMVQTARRDFPAALVVGIVTTTRERDTLLAAGANVCVSIPRELSSLPGILDDFAAKKSTATSAPPRSRSLHPQLTRNPQATRDALELFMGAAPELLASIAEAIERQDATSARTACESLNMNAEALGSSQLARLSAACGAFAEDGDFPTARGFVSELEVEYGHVFREMMVLHSQTTELQR